VSFNLGHHVDSRVRGTRTRSTLEALGFF